METTIHNTKVKMVGDELYSFIKRGKTPERRWFHLKGTINPQTGYRHVIVNGRYTSVHRLVYKLHNPDWDIYDNSTSNYIDHKDRNKLNNNIENLRVLTHQQNQWNRKCKGYYWRPKEKKYQAQIKVDARIKYLGFFEKEEDAANAYLEAKKIYHHIE